MLVVENYVLFKKLPLPKSTKVRRSTAEDPVLLPEFQHIVGWTYPLQQFSLLVDSLAFFGSYVSVGV